jgi:hypothetical protein
MELKYLFVIRDFLLANSPHGTQVIANPDLERPMRGRRVVSEKNEIDDYRLFESARFFTLSAFRSSISLRMACFSARGHKLTSFSET